MNEGLPVAEAAVSAVGIHKTYIGGDGSRLDVLTGADLLLEPGETVAIIGESGSGKSTLLHILGGLDLPTEGEVRIGGESLRELDEDGMGKLRNESIGFVFQFHHLLREFTVLENVMIPQLIGGRERRSAADRARALLQSVGLESRLEHKPMQLSGGEQQRVAVARALANEPLALLADEPSGNLDPSTSGLLHDLLFAVNEEHGTAMVLVTHNMQLAGRAGRVLEVRDGKLAPAAPEAIEYPKRSVV
jgi:lipoprotein-releasing system ATP-binding protein